GEKVGRFNVVVDMRAVEEVSVFQVREIAGTPVADIWASFNQRSEARNPEAVAHEDKSAVEVLSYEIDGTSGPGNNIDAKTTMRLKARNAGARLLNFDLSPALHVTSVVSEAGDPIPYYQYAGASSFAVVLPEPLK